MDGFRPETYGDRIADVYDDLMVDLPDPADCVDRLAELAGPGPALELGIGTGRIALPLAARGVEVHGIDASAAMVERLRAKPGGEAIPVTFGNFADVPVEGRYPLVYVVFNTFFALLTQDDQVRCFAGVAGHLAPGGAFALQGFVPDLTLHPGGQSVRATHLGLDHARLDVARHDPVAQRVDFQHVLLTGGGIRLLPGAVRYAWPSELDLMARLAGLRLRERWGGWRQEPFGAGSGLHVSVYEHARVATS
ncbi:MAG TPA: class I SAM-dependent methyltransferase [Actinomycetota bacterium]|nr:class I SAM-dependent methyltransferase [Actinomycetota bacterium]